MWLTMSDDSVEEVIEEVAVGTIVRGLEVQADCWRASGTGTLIGRDVEKCGSE